MPAMVRPPVVADLEALAALDAQYARRHGVATQVDRSSLAFYGRSGHAFVREDASGPLGFALAHAVWDGGRPVVRLSRLVAVADDPAVLAALLEAVVKSAYDAGVYDLAADVPAGDAGAQAALRGAAFEPRPVVRFERVLGSRGAPR